MLFTNAHGYWRSEKVSASIALPVQQSLKNYQRLTLKRCSSNAFLNDNPHHAVLTRQAIAESVSTASSPIAYVEVSAAFSSLKHAKRITGRKYQRAVQDFERDWSAVEQLEVGESLSRLAGAIAASHLLRGCDALHIATAVTLQAMGSDLKFLTFDLQLSKRIAGSSLLKLWQP